MSWPLFNHNHYVRDVPTGDVPGVGDEITSSVIYTSGVPDLGQRDSLSALKGSGFFAAGTNDRIMVIEDFSWTMQFSDDLGETWATKATPVEHDSYHAAAVQYRESDDTWFVIMITDPTGARDGYLYYSQDDGDTWTRVDTNVYFDYRFTTCLVMQDGNVATTGYANAGGDNLAIDLYTDCPDSEASTTLLHTDRVNDVQNHLLEFGTGHMIQNNYSQYITITEPAASASDNWSASYGGWGWGSNPDGKLLLPVSFSTTDLTYAYWLATDTSQGASDIETFSNTINGSGFGWSAEEGYMMVTGNGADISHLQIKLSADGASWSGEYFIDLTVDKESSAGGYYFNQFQLRNIGSGRWLIGFINNSTNRLNIALFTFDPSTTPVGQYTGMVAAIMPQSPDIFMRMDDLIGVTTVVDLGTKQYVNAVLGTPTFESPGVVDDGGTSMLIPSAADTGILVSAVPAPINHAHVFIMQQDGSATLRVLAGSLEEGYVIVLSTTHQLGYGVYDGGWTYTYSTEVVSDDTATLMAALVDDGEVTFYVEDVGEAPVAIDVPAIATGLLTLGGLSTGSSTLSTGADGVTIDNYALIPKETFDYGLINNAWGGNYTPPGITDVAVSSDVAFLMHADESAMLGPFASERVLGSSYYTMLNSVPGSVNRISSESSGRLDTSDFKFGSGSGAIVPRSVTPSNWQPWDTIYWPISDATPSQRGLPELILGVRDFTFDTWVRPLVNAPFNVWESSWIATSNGYKQYGGMQIIVTPKGTGLADITINTYGPKGAPGLESRQKFSSMTGYNNADWNHIAVCRENGVWFVFINGVRGTYPSIYASTGSPETAYLHEGTGVILGTKITASGSSYSRTQAALLFDETRLVLDQALLTTSFTPPVAAYSYT